mgnify:CR=1 FL=1
MLRSVADQAGIKFGALVHAARIAVTGRAVSPGLFETLVLIGRDHVGGASGSAGALSGRARWRGSAEGA